MLCLLLLTYSQVSGLSNAVQIPFQPTCFLELKEDLNEDKTTGKPYIIDEDELFDPGYDYDFSDLKDTETYYRGGEVYERPCGWYRLALKVNMLLFLSDYKSVSSCYILQHRI